MSLRHASATALIALLLFAGCSDGNDPPEPLPTRTPSEAADPPSSTPPTAVSLTDAPEGETAKQFIRRWVKLGNHMQATGDTEGFLAVAGPDCNSCQQFADHVGRIYGAGGSIETEGDQFIKARHDGGDQWTVVLDGAPSVIRNLDKGDESLPGGTYELLLYIVNDSGIWILVDYQDKN